MTFSSSFADLLFFSSAFYNFVFFLVLLRSVPSSFSRCFIVAVVAANFLCVSFVDCGAKVAPRTKFRAKTVFAPKVCNGLVDADADK